MLILIVLLFALAFVAFASWMAVKLFQIQGHVKRMVNAILPKQTQLRWGANKMSFIGINEKDRELTFVDVTDKKPQVVSYRDILESYIVADESTLTKTSRSSQLGGALVGGVLAGRVGAVIGGLSGKKTSVDTVSRLTLCVVVNDTKKPVRKIMFFSSSSPVKKSSFTYRMAYDEIDKWHRLISVLIRQADEEDKVAEPPAEVNVSAADELKKFADLRDSGVITPEEFAAKKAQLLGL